MKERYGLLERLLLTPKPLEDESLAGYILRITDYNGYENSSWIYTMAIFEESMLRKILMI